MTANARVILGAIVTRGQTVRGDSHRLLANMIIVWRKKALCILDRCLHLETVSTLPEKLKGCVCVCVCERV